jgi:hypothetical protein
MKVNSEKLSIVVLTKVQAKPGFDRQPSARASN